MAVCYNKLWKLLNDKGWKCKDLEANAQISRNVMTHLGKGQYVTMESMEKIYSVLGYSIGDVIRICSSKIRISEEALLWQRASFMIMLLEKKCITILKKNIGSFLNTF